MAQYREAVEEFSKAVDTLRECNGIGLVFPEQHGAPEQARLQAKNARLCWNFIALNTGVNSPVFRGEAAEPLFGIVRSRRDVIGGRG